jgi:hypothetical protein
MVSLLLSTIGVPSRVEAGVITGVPGAEDVCAVEGSLLSPDMLARSSKPWTEFGWKEAGGQIPNDAISG